jgi:hypothetical protein
LYEIKLLAGGDVIWFVGARLGFVVLCAGCRCVHVAVCSSGAAVVPKMASLPLSFASLLR